LNGGVRDGRKRRRGIRRYWKDHKDIENADTRVERRRGQRERRNVKRTYAEERTWTWKIEERERERERMNDIY